MNYFIPQEVCCGISNSIWVGVAHANTEEIMFKRWRVVEHWQQANSNTRKLKFLTFSAGWTTLSPLCPSVKTIKTRGAPSESGRSPDCSLNPVATTSSIAAPVRVPPAKHWNITPHEHALQIVKNGETADALWYNRRRLTIEYHEWTNVLPNEF